MDVIRRGTGRPGGTLTVNVCLIRFGIRSRLGIGMSNQTTALVEGGIVVVASSGLAISDVASSNRAPRKRSMVRSVPASRTLTERTSTGTGNAFSKRSS